MSLWLPCLAQYSYLLKHCLEHKRPLIFGEVCSLQSKNYLVLILCTLGSLVHSSKRIQKKLLGKSCMIYRTIKLLLNRKSRKDLNEMSSLKLLCEKGCNSHLQMHTSESPLSYFVVVVAVDKDSLPFLRGLFWVLFLTRPCSWAYPWLPKFSFSKKSAELAYWNTLKNSSSYPWSHHAALHSARILSQFSENPYP